MFSVIFKRVYIPIFGGTVSVILDKMWNLTLTLYFSLAPEVFCVSVETESARVCWKDPTNGSYVMKYELLLQVDDGNATKRPVEVKGVKDETCTIIDGDQIGKNYTFTVRVLNGLEWSPQSLQRKVRVERLGTFQL